MNTNKANKADRESLHVVFGAGGSRAALGGAGAILAFHLTGLKRWKTIGGASGGTIPAAFLAAGVEPKTILHLITEVEFISLLTPKTGIIRRLWALLMKYRHERNRPAKGVYSSAKLGSFIDAQVKSWPRGYWAVAACDHGQVLMTEDGVHKYCLDGTVLKIRNGPYTVGDAVRASCAVPGIIDALNIDGENLFDGALSVDGECPVEVVGRHFKDDISKVVAFDVGEEEIKKSWMLRFVWWLVSFGGASIAAKHPDEQLGATVIRSEIKGFHALKFRLDINDKWRAIIAGYRATLKRLEEAGIVDRSESQQAFELEQEFADILANAPKAQVASQVESLLTGKKLF